MAPRNADDISSSQQRQEQIDELQRGTQVENALYSRRVGGKEQLVFSLDRIKGISKETRDSIKKALGGQVAIDKFKTEAEKMTPAQRKEAIHEFMDDAVADREVLESFLDTNDDVKKELAEALEIDMESPVDFEGRPDAVIFMKTLIFAVEVPARPVKTYEDRLNAKRLELIRSVASIPYEKGEKKLRDEKTYLDKRRKVIDDLAKPFESDTIDKFGNELAEKTGGANGLLALYPKIAKLGSMREQAVIEKELAKAEAEFESMTAQIKGLSTKGKKIPDKIINAHSAAKADSAKLKAELKKREELEAAIKERPSKEAAHRKQLLDVCEKLQKANKELAANGLKLDLPGATTVTNPGTPSPPTLNVSKFDDFVTILSANKLPINPKTPPIDNDKVFVQYYGEVLKPWLETSKTIDGVTKTYAEWINSKLSSVSNDFEKESEKVQAKLDSRNKKRKKKKSDKEFNVGLHLALANEDSRLASVPNKELERDIRINLELDVADLEQDGRIGKSFDKNKAGIWHSIDASNRAKFYHLLNLKFNQDGKVVEPMKGAEINLSTPGAISKSILNELITPPQAIRIYAALCLIGQKNHAETQLVRRTLVDKLNANITPEAAEKFNSAIEQASSELSHVSSVAAKDHSAVESFIGWRAKRHEKAARKANLRAGNMKFSEHLAAKKADDLTLTTAGAVGALAKHGFYKASPHVLMAGRDSSKYAAKNAYGLGKATTGLMLGTGVNVVKVSAKHLKDNFTINPFKIALGTVKLGVKGTVGIVKAPFTPLQTLRTISGRKEGELFNYEYTKFEKGKDLVEKASQKAEKAEAAAEVYKGMEREYMYQKTRKYDWESWTWNDNDGGEVIDFNKAKKNRNKPKPKAKSDKTPSETQAAA